MSSEWQRLSPAAIIYFAVRAMVQLLNTYAVVLAGILAASQLGFSSVQTMVYAALALLVLVLGSLLYYLNFAYVQEPGRFLIRHGIFAKNRTELPFNKIQNVSLKEPFYYRPFGLVVLSMDSAGSSSKEVALAALSRQKAEEIQQTIAQFNNLHGDNSEPAQVPQSQIADMPKPALLLSRSTADVVFHGLAHNRTWLFLALATPLLAQMDQRLQPLLESLGLQAGEVAAQLSLLALVALAVFAVVAVVLLLSLLSVAGAVLSMANLKLFYDRGTYKRSSGLLNRYEIQLKRSRVQTLRYQQNWIDLLAKRLNLVLEPFAVAGLADKGDIMQKVLLPSINRSQFNELAGHVFPGFDLDGVSFTAAHKLYLVRTMLLLVLPAVVAAALLAVGSGLWQLLVPALVGVAATGAALLRWHRLGVGISGRYVVMRSGFIGCEYYCFAAHKTQQVKIYQSLLLKRRGLATLEIVLASRSLTMPLIPEEQAFAIAEQCLQASELSGLSWM